MKRLVVLWVASLGIIAMGIFSTAPPANAAGIGHCALMGFLVDSWQCQFEAARIELVSCGKCIYDAADNGEWMYSCPWVAPDDCIMIESTETCGEPEEYCETLVFDCEGLVDCAI